MIPGKIEDPIRIVAFNGLQVQVKVRPIQEDFFVLFKLND